MTHVQSYGHCSVSLVTGSKFWAPGGLPTFMAAEALNSPHLPISHPPTCAILVPCCPVLCHPSWPSLYSCFYCWQDVEARIPAGADFALWKKINKGKRPRTVPKSEWMRLGLALCCEKGGGKPQGLVLQSGEGDEDWPGAAFQGMTSCPISRAYLARQSAGKLCHVLLYDCIT